MLQVPAVDGNLRGHNGRGDWHGVRMIAISPWVGDTRKADANPRVLHIR